VEGLCEQVDISPFTDILPEASNPQDLGSDYGDSSSKSCSVSLTDGSSFGSVSYDAQTSSDPADSVYGYELCVEIQLESFGSLEEVNDPWEQGTIGVGPPIATAGAQLCAVDGNLEMSVYFSLSGDAASNDEMAAAVLEVANNVLEVTAQ
jgi:hypothetical protein